MMESEKGKSAVPIVKKFEIEGSWAPRTPLKWPEYENGEIEAYLSRFSEQNHNQNENQAQTLLSYSITSAETSNRVINNGISWENNVEMQTSRGYLPNWNIQGRRTKSNYSNTPGAGSAAAGQDGNLSSWPWRNNNGSGAGAGFGLGLGHHYLDQLHDATMSFGDLLAMNASAAYLPPNGDCNHAAGVSHGLNGSSVFCNQNSLQQQDILHQQINSGQKNRGLESCASPLQYKGICDVNSPQTTKHANGKNSTFAPTTPDSRWRIESDVAFKNAPFGPYQSPFNRDNVLSEQDVAAAIVNLQNANEEVVVPNTTDSSPGVASMTVENHNPDQGDDQVIDLNKTPQKKARRRRYQPKVISEKKPKQTPKPKTPKPNTDSKETSQGKRKYVRKNKVNTPSTPPPEGVTEAGEPTPAATEAEATKETVSAAKSCKKSLNFDLNGVAEESNSPHIPNGESYAEPKPSKCATAGVQCWGTKHLRQGEELVVETSCGVTAYDLTRNSYHEIQYYLSLPTKDHPDTPQSRNYVHPGRNTNSSPCGSSNEPEETRGTKRSNLCLEDFNAVRVGASHCSEPSHPISGNATVGELHKNFLPDNCKKKRTEKVFRANISNMSYAIAPHEYVNQAASAKYYCDPAPFGCHVVTDDHAKVLEGSVENGVQLLNTLDDVARLKKKKRSKRTTLVRNLDPLKGILPPLPGKPGPKGPRKKKNNNECFQHPTSDSIQTCAETLAVDSKASPKPKGKSRKRKSSKQWDLVLYDQSSRKTTGFSPARPWVNTGLSSVEEITERMRLLDLNKGGCNTSLQEQNAVVIYNKKKQEQNAVVIYNKKKQEQNEVVIYNKKKQEQYALVVYERNGTMVPFDGPFNPVRKRRQRAKVDLDDETTRVWKLLLENIDNKGIDGSDEDKAKWWENERSVFRGRVDSFIARMRLVQGDRRFTPWKGSVLDSVIGVFLTQNVSDHLSSSAFMAMAAHFPLKSECSESTISEESTTAFVEEPDVIEPVESTTWDNKAMDQQILSSKPRNVHEIDHIEAKEVVNSIEPKALGLVSPKDCSSESSNRAYNGTSQITETETASLLGDDRAKDDVTSSQHSVISSQNSTNSPHLQAAADIMSFFPENSSRTEHLTTSTLCSYYDSTPFLDLLKMAESPFFHESYSETQIDPLEYKNHVADRSLEAERVCPGDTLLNLNFQLPDTEGIELLVEETGSPDTSRKDENSSPTDQSNLTTESAIHHSSMEKSSDTIPRLFAENSCSFYVLEGENMVMQTHRKSEEPKSATVSVNGQTSSTSKGINLSQLTAGVTESTTGMKRTRNDQKEVEISDLNANTSTSKKGKAGKGKIDEFDWDSLRREAKANGRIREKTANTKDSLDWEAVRHAHVSEIAETIKERGMNNMLAERIKELLDRLVRDHGSMDMEWLRDIPPDKAKEYLLSFRGLGLKSVECVRLLTLHHLAFPVDTNVARIAVRLGWVPLQPLPESLQLHLLELYPILETIQKYLWPRLCKLDQRTLYELHYHLITFGKVFCTKRQPNCNACPLRGECRHFASAFASARFALPGPEEKGIVPSSRTNTASPRPQATSNFLPLPPAWSTQYSQSNSRCDNGAPLLEISSSPLALPSPETRHQLEKQSEIRNCEPIVEVPASPEPEPHIEQTLCDIEDTFDEDPNEIPVIKLNMEEFSQTLQNYMQTKSNALVPLTPEAASIPTPKLKNVNRLRTEHHVYELPDTHPLLKSLDKREPDDPCSYLLAIWTPGETADSIRPPERRCNSEDPNIMCNEETCSYCNCQREANSQIVRGTLLIPCRTAMRGSFPLNGTYFQVNEVFADHDSSLNPIAVPRTWLWNLPRRTVYFGTSIPTIFRGLSTEEIQHCFRRGFVCVRGFDQKRRAPRPLMARLHFPASRMSRGTKGKTYDE